MSDGVRFVHAADLHLGAPFSGVGADDARVGAALAEATFSAFDRVIEVCLDREARFLVIAGDAYNSADASLRAQLHFLAGMQRLADAGIEVFVAHGNHDPASGWSAGLALPDSVHVFPADTVARFDVAVDGQPIAAVYGRSFARAAETENLAVGYTRESGDLISVGVLHCNVGGNADYDNYAPASLDELKAARMDYWALGHIHKQEVLARDPWIVYPGSTQGLNPKETGPHGCLVVDVSPSGDVRAEHVETAPVAWAQVDCDLSSAVSVEEVRALLTAACEAIRTEAGRPAVARVSLTGRTPVHGELARKGLLSDLVESVRRDQAVVDPWVWIDRVVDRTASVLDLEAIRAGGDFSAELLRIADELLADPAQLRAIVAEIADPLDAPLPGYRPGASPEQTLLAARDAALDLLLVQGGESA